METSTNSTKQQKVNIDADAGLTWTQHFHDVNVWDTVTWRSAPLPSATLPETWSSLKDIDVPTTWSMTATNVVVSKSSRTPRLRR